MTETSASSTRDQAVIADQMNSSLRRRAQFSRFKRTDSPSWLAGIRSFYKTVKEGRPDIVHLYSGGHLVSAAPYALIARRFGAKTIFHHTSITERIQPHGFLARACARFALKRCSKVIVPTDSTRREAETIVSAQRLSVVRDAARLEDFRRLPNRNKARAALNLPVDKVIVLTLIDSENSNAEKDIVASAQLVMRMDDSVHFVIAGSSVQSDSASSANIKRIPGEIDDPTLGLLLGAADIYVMPVITESTPVALIEAMGARLPVIAPDAAPVSEFVENETTGLLLDPSRLSEMPDAIERLSKDKNLRERMQSAAFERFSRMFDVERTMVPALTGIYNELVPSAITIRHAPAPDVRRERPSQPRSEARQQSPQTEQPADRQARPSRSRRRNDRRRRKPQQPDQSQAEQQAKPVESKPSERQNEEKQAKPESKPNERHSEEKQDAREQSQRRRDGRRRPRDRNFRHPEEVEPQLVSDETPDRQSEQFDTEDDVVKVVYKSKDKPQPRNEEEKPDSDKKQPAPETKDEAQKRLEEAAERWEEQI